MIIQHNLTYKNSWATLGFSFLIHYVSLDWEFVRGSSLAQQDLEHQIAESGTGNHGDACVSATAEIVTMNISKSHRIHFTHFKFNIARPQHNVEASKVATEDTKKHSEMFTDHHGISWSLWSSKIFTKKYDFLVSQILSWALRSPCCKKTMHNIFNFFPIPYPPLPRLSFGWLLKYLQIKCTASTSHVILVVFSIWSKKPNFFPNLLPS